MASDWTTLKDVLLNILREPAVQGLAALIAILSFIANLKGPRELLRQRPRTNWITQVSPVWLLGILAVAAGTTIGLNRQDPYPGLASAFAIMTFGIGRQLRQSERSLIKTRSDQDNLGKALRRVASHQGDFHVDDWRIVHEIDEHGNDSLHEELTIVPVSDPVYFYFKGYSISLNHHQPLPQVSAHNRSADTPLEVIEFDATDRKIRYGVLLDPPSTKDKPQRIVLKCKRTGLWKALIETHKDQGALRASHRSDSIHIEIVAPLGAEWASYTLAPQDSGTIRREESGGRSRIVVSIQNSATRKYHYDIRLK